MTARLGFLVSCLVSLVPCPAFSQDPPKATLRWYGQSFFQLETSTGKKVVFDPHAIPVFGRPLVSADLVLVSHPHDDHNQPEVLENAKDKPRVIEAVKTVKGTRTEWNPVDEKVGLVRVRSLGTYHDAAGGMQRGKNGVWVVEADGLVVVHLGDLGHELSAEQAKAIGKVDVLLVPVGGIYTLNGEQARKVVEQLNPQLFVVPMHYGVPGYDDLLTPDEFLSEFKDVKKLTTNELAIPLDSKPDAPTVVLMHWQKVEAPAPPKK